MICPRRRMAVRAEVRWLLCLAHRHRNRVNLQSKNQKPLERYFPEVARGIEQIAEDGFVLDGELVIVRGSFEALQLRLHPAESRIRRLWAPKRLV
jgi:ATP-dependent DNA ligase